MNGDKETAMKGGAGCDTCIWRQGEPQGQGWHGMSGGERVLMGHKLEGYVRDVIERQVVRRH